MGTKNAPLLKEAHSMKFDDPRIDYSDYFD